MSFINDFDVNTTLEPAQNPANSTPLLPLVSQTQNTDNKLIDLSPTTMLQLQTPSNNNDEHSDADGDGTLGYK